MHHSFCSGASPLAAPGAGAAARLARRREPAAVTPRHASKHARRAGTVHGRCLGVARRMLGEAKCTILQHGTIGPAWPSLRRSPSAPRRRACRRAAAALYGPLPVLMPS